MFNVNKYSILGIVTRTFRLSKKIIEQWQILFYYAAMLTIWALLFGFWVYKCKSGGGIFCWVGSSGPYAMTGMLLWFLPLLHLYFAFINDFYDASFNNNPFKVNKLWKITKSKAKAELVFLGYALGFILPVVVGGKFLMQETNPDWQVEMVHFIIIFSLVMFMLFLLRTSAAVSIYLQKRKFPDLWLIFEKTSGLGYVAIIMFLLLMAFSLLSYMFMVEKLQLIPERQTNILVMALTMYTDNLLKLFYVALILLYCRAQHELLQPADFAAAVSQEVEVTVVADTPAIRNTEPEKAPVKKKAVAKKTTKITAKSATEKKTRTDKPTAQKRGRPAKKKETV